MRAHWTASWVLLCPRFILAGLMILSNFAVYTAKAFPPLRGVFCLGSKSPLSPNVRRYISEH